MRGGVSYIANRHGQANNKYMEAYGKSKPSKYIFYLDANISMVRLCPNAFHWEVTNNEIDKLDLGKLGENSPKRLTLEDELEYPSELHDKHNDYPLAPKKL